MGIQPQIDSFAHVCKGLMKVMTAAQDRRRLFIKPVAQNYGILLDSFCLYIQMKLPAHSDLTFLIH